MQAKLFSLLILSCGSLLMTTGLSAQQMFKCGNTYSQTPCDAAAAPKKIFSDSRASGGSNLRGADLCKERILKTAGFKDTESVKFEKISDGKPEVMPVADVPMMVRKFELMVNSKNSYGAYSGAKQHICYLSEDNARVLKLQSPRVD